MHSIRDLSGVGECGNDHAFSCKVRDSLEFSRSNVDTLDSLLSDSTHP